MSGGCEGFGPPIDWAEGGGGEGNGNITEDRAVS